MVGRCGAPRGPSVGCRSAMVGKRRAARWDGPFNAAVWADSERSLRHVDTPQLERMVPRTGRSISRTRSSSFMSTITEISAPQELFRGAEGLWDPLAKVPFRLDQPASVRSAIRSGAVGMGSFMTPFLDACPNAEVRHLCQSPKAVRTADHRIALADVPDTLLDQRAVRPAIRLDECPRVTGPGCYRLTPHLTDWVAELGSGPILLHIDMDYFNNRYDGDSDWLERPQVLDPPLDEITARMDHVVRTLDEAGLGSRIEDIVIAYSPGFFPAEFWSASADRLIPALERLHGS